MTMTPYRLIDAAMSSATTDKARSRIEEITVGVDGYAEPGYTAEEYIAFGNWNDVDGDDTLSRLAELLERAGVQVEWSDEWTTCDDCGKAVRTQPDCYQWKRYYHIDDDGVTCGDCIKQDPAAYAESLEGSTTLCASIHADFEQAGYRHLPDSYENGLHEGMASDPKLIGKALREQGIERFFFELDEASQFYVTFSVWVHNDELDKLDPAKFDQAPKDQVPSPAERCKEMLRSASIQTAKQKGDTK